MRVTVITACTGVKKYNPENRLTKKDFLNLSDKNSFASKEEELSDFKLPAEEMYLGQQHIRLMEGIKQFRQTQGNDSIEFWILSAGYGFIKAKQKIVPYEFTFQGMKEQELRNWAQHLKIPRDARNIFTKQADLILVLLGAPYLKALQLNAGVTFPYSTIFLASKGSSKYIKGKGQYKIVPLGKEHARAFSCGLVGLKGEIAKRLLKKLTVNPVAVKDLLNPQKDFIEVLGENEPGPMSV